MMTFRTVDMNSRTSYLPRLHFGHNTIGRISSESSSLEQTDRQNIALHVPESTDRIQHCMPITVHQIKARLGWVGVAFQVQWNSSRTGKACKQQT